MKRLGALWAELSGSLWLVPALIVLGAVALAVGLIELGPQEHLAKAWPRVFGAGASGARSMLSAIASSMITVAGVVFSVTIVSLTLAASQYSSRVLRTFMRDRPTQAVLGAFVGVFAYCLIVLRTVRGGQGEDGFVPSAAVLGAIVLAFVAIGLLVFFIHHLASAIQASSILWRVCGETFAAVDRLFPEPLGKGDDEAMPAAGEGCDWHPLAARRTGYIVAVEDRALLRFAAQRGAVVRMERGIGDFVTQGQPLASLSRPAGAGDERALDAVYSIGRQRTIQQDAAFGVQQILDIALRGLSPGVNDTTTALMCVDYLSAILVRVCGRRLPSPLRHDGGELRVIAEGPTFEGLAALAFDGLRRNAEGNFAVLSHLLHSIEAVGAAAPAASRRRLLARHARAVASTAERSIAAEEGRALAARGVRLARRLEA